MAITAITRQETALNAEVRYPINEAGRVVKRSIFDLELDLTSANTYEAGGFSIATILTALGIAAAGDVIDCRIDDLVRYNAGARVYTTGFRCQYDYVNRKVVLRATAIAGAGAGSGAESGDREVVATTAINGATYLNGNTARCRVDITYRTARSAI